MSRFDSWAGSEWAALGGPLIIRMVVYMKRFRDFLHSLWEWVKVVALWLLIVGAIVLGSLIEHLVIVI